MDKKTIYLIIGVIIIVLIIVAVKGFSILGEKDGVVNLGGVQPPDNLATSDELGGNPNAPKVAGQGSGQVKGSCYIKADSQCIEYLGVAFSPDRIKAVCGNEGAVISAGTCPVEAKVGGCRAMMGTEIEMISWSYSNGDKPVAGDMLNMNKIFCNGMAKSQWVDPSGKVVPVAPANS